MGGVDPMTMMAVSTGAKMLGSAMGGGAQAAPAAGGVNPMTAGLIGMAPPVPEKNPAFHPDQAGGLGGPAAVIKDRPELQGLFDQLQPKPEGAAAGMFERTPDAVNSFDSKPWTKETVYGQPASTAAAAAPRAPAQPVTTEDVATDGPFQAAADDAQLPPPPQAAASGWGQGYDKTAPAKPGQSGRTPEGGASGLFDGFSAWAKGVPTNPMSQIGLSLLASGYDGTNPYSGMQTSLGNIPRLELAMRSGRIAQAAADRAEKSDARSEAERAREAELGALIAAMAAEYSAPEYESASRVARNAAKVIK